MNERYCKDWIGTNCWISWTWEQELFLCQLSLDNPTVRLANDVCVCQKYRKNMEFYPGTVFPLFIVKVNLASNHVDCVASVSVWSRSKERPRNEILGFRRARNATRAIARAVFDSRSSFFAPKPHGNACCAGYQP